MIVQTHDPKLKVAVLPALRDNYIFVLFHSETKEAVVIDPGVAAPALDFLEQNDLRLNSILLTHHHWDHIDGVKDILSAQPDCKLLAPAKNKDSIGKASEWIEGGENFTLLGTPFDVIAVPGHTLGHIAYHLPQAQALFCGDTLFAFGCGRLFEGTPAMMWESLKKLRSLPKVTLMFCAHEYTVDNLKFALHLEPQNAELSSAKERALLRRRNNEPTIPVTLEQQRKLNPFLRADDIGLAQKLGKTHESSESFFAVIRSLKDKF